MVRAWYMDNDSVEQRNENHLIPSKFVTLTELTNLSGVEYFKLNTKTLSSDGAIEKIKKERGYTYEDELVCSKECLPDYKEKLKIFYTEHLHADDEIRLCTEGSGYFDVRDKNDNWIRVEVTPGDMLLLPSGIYHRFTLDNNDYIRVRRFFIGEPVWKAHNRPAEDMDCRKKYIKKLENGF